MTRTILATALAAVLAGPVAAQGVDQGAKNVPQFEPAFENQTRAPAMQTAVELRASQVVSGLEHPWGIAVLPGGGYLVTERPGRLRHVAADGTLSDPISGVPDVVARRQGGLLDVALSPDFASDRMIYLTYAKPMGGGNATAAAKAVLSDDLSALTDVQDIFVQTPASTVPMHFGSRIVIDGNHAFITTGEHSSQQTRVFAQDLDKTYGKVVRVRLDGSVSSSNPFTDREGARPEIWTLGHRNPQGAALHPSTGDLWVLEHGPAGGDELNLIERGANYGWPVVSYGRQYSGPLIGSGQPRAEGFTEPRYYWDPVIAPGGFAFYDGRMFPEWRGNVLAASLNPGGLVRLSMNGDTVTGEERLFGDLGRVRDVEIDADGSVLLLTDRDNGGIVRISRGG